MANPAEKKEGVHSIFISTKRILQQVICSISKK